MIIRESYRKNVVVTLKNNEKYIGFVIDYENPLESETGNYCMDLETNDGFYSTDDSEIKEIEIISWWIISNTIYKETINMTIERRKG